MDQPSAKDVDVEYGIEVSGVDFEGTKAVFSYDPSDFVLSCFHRFDGGTARGDQETIDKMRSLFFRI